MVTKPLKAMVGVVVVAAAMVIPAEASASTRAVAAAPDCQFGNSYGVRVARAEVTTDSGTSVGEIQLCRDGDYDYWGFILLDNPPTASQYGDAVLERTRSGLPSYVGCDSSGGNGIVLPGQTRCWTPKLTGLSGAYTFRAEGTLTSSHTNTTVAFGSTIETR